MARRDTRIAALRYKWERAHIQKRDLHYYEQLISLELGRQRRETYGSTTRDRPAYHEELLRFHQGVIEHAQKMLARKLTKDARRSYEQRIQYHECGVARQVGFIMGAQK